MGKSKHVVETPDIESEVQPPQPPATRETKECENVVAEIPHPAHLYDASDPANTPEPEWYDCPGFE